DPAYYELKKSELSRSIMQRLSSIEKNYEYILSGGDKKHATYEIFIKKINMFEEEEIQVRCDNAGSGIRDTYPSTHRSFPNQQLHTIVEKGDKSFVASRIIGKTDINSSALQKFLIHFIHS